MIEDFMSFFDITRQQAKKDFISPKVGGKKEPDSLAKIPQTVTKICENKSYRKKFSIHSPWGGFFEREMRMCLEQRPIRWSKAVTRCYGAERQRSIPGEQSSLGNG